jgi:hypothetical protein
MAYKTFIAGEEALASDVNSLLMSQTVSRFATAAARASAITAPVLNQLTVLDSAPGLLNYWNGSAWVMAPPTYERFITVVQPSWNVSSSAPYEFSLTTFTMPFTGTVIMTGIVQWWPGTVASIVNGLMDVGPTSAPAATATQQWVGPSMAANAYYVAMPFMWKWSNVAAGTTVIPKMKLSTNTSTVLVIQNVAADFRVIQAEW